MPQQVPSANLRIHLAVTCGAEKMLTRTRMKTLLKVPSTSKFLDLTFHVYFTLGCHFMLEPLPVSSNFNIFPLRFTWSSWRPKRPKRPRRPAPSESEASDRSPTVAAAFEASNVRGSVGLCSCFHGSSALTTLGHFEIQSRHSKH